MVQNRQRLPGKNFYGVVTRSWRKIHPKDECVFIFREGKEWVLLATYVDDIFALRSQNGHSLRDRVLGKLRSHMIIEN